jgi:hypothetical protein
MRAGWRRWRDNGVNVVKTALLSLALLASALLAGCAGVPPLSNDSLRAECDWKVHYPQVAAPGATLAELQAVATARLAALQLTPAWTLAHEQASAEAFGDTDDDRRRLRTLLETILPAFERYPAALFRNIALRQVVLVKNLEVAGQRRLAMPAPETDSVIYAENGAHQLCQAGMELRAHHELYHFIEHRQFNDFYYRDPAWMAFNPAGIEYGQGGATAYGKGFQNLGHPQPGLVSMYAQYGPEEDKAEVFGWMMTPAYAGRLRQWLPGDTALAAKQRFLQQLLDSKS